jgi:large subunit ribosomal protein L1
MRGKLYKAVKEKTPQQVVDLETAVAFLKEHARSTFDETVEIHVLLGVQPQKSDQMVRGSVVLPHGTPKKKRIAVFTDDTALQKAAKDAGAKIVGGDDLIADVQSNGALEADVTVATPNMMPKIARIAKILGPKGLMPNPKTGTVTPDVAKAVQELAGGKVAFKMDQLGNIHEAVGKVSWDAKKIQENTAALLEAVRASRPATQKGEFIRSVTVKSTMSPAVRIAPGR